MTWPDGIAAVLGLTTTALLTLHQHQQRSTTPNHPTRRTENGHAHQQPGPQNQQQQASREEDRRPQNRGKEGTR